MPFNLLPPLSLPVRMARSWRSSQVLRKPCEPLPRMLEERATRWRLFTDVLLPLGSSINLSERSPYSQTRKCEDNIFAGIAAANEEQMCLRYPILDAMVHR